MKKVILSLFAVTIILGAVNRATAQVNVSINLGSQPAWGPTGYDNAPYYYIPDADAYYDIANRVFWYQQGPQWVSGPALPGQYRNLDLYSTYKVVINQPQPWTHANTYRKQYARYRGRHDQQVIRDSHEPKYFQNPGHPQHAQWEKEHGHDEHGHDDHGHGGHDHR